MVSHSFELDRPTLLVLAYLTISAVFLLVKGKSPRNGRLPPTPRGYPFFGNLFDIIKAGKANKMHYLMQNYAKQYGAVVRVKVGPNEVNRRHVARFPISIFEYPIVGLLSKLGKSGSR